MTTIKLFWAKEFAFFFFFLAFFLFLFLWGVFFFFKINLHSLPAGVNPGTADQFSTCLSAICQVFFLWTRAQKQKKPIVFFFSLSLSLIIRWSRPLLLNSSSALLRYFSLNQSSGMLTVRQNTPAGSYWLRVGVSDGVWPDVISGVRVHVRELEEKAILSSASLRLTGNVSRNTDSPGDINTVLILNH